MHKFKATYEIVMYNNGTRIKNVATAYDERYATCITALLNIFRPCRQCGQPIELSAVSLCEPCIEARIDPMSPDYAALSEQEPVTASADSRDAAGV